VSAFTSANIERILALRPDLVIGFSDIQADIARDLIKRGLNVLIFNQRSVTEILGVICTLGALVGEAGRAQALAAELEKGLAGIRAQAGRLARRPRVYFEEWDEPMISGIRWVSELIGIAGGDDIFPELALSQDARGRIVADPGEVPRRAPDIILGSWCGKKFRPERVRARPGWSTVPAVRDGQLFEIKSAEILQPGPAALTDGVRRIHAILREWAEVQSA
jgi:iron complex transport system substrate-binding protein